MKKISLLILNSAFLILNSFGQANLPTTWSSDGTAPTGWTTSGTAFYTGSAAYSAPSSLKLDSDNDYLQINVADEPGAVTYYLKGSTTGSPWEGTFTIQESVNGSAWTTLRQFTDGVPSVTAYTLYTDNPNPASRYIRFYYTDKISGSNIALDDINIAIPAAGPPQEIAVSQGPDVIVSGGNASVGANNGSSADLTLTVSNLGTVNTLNISSTTITGTNASEFVVTSAPTTVGATTSDIIVISFTPGATGTRTAQLSIGNDDSNENPFIVNLYGYGDFLATQPTQQATSLAFGNVRSYRFNGSFTPASPAVAGYLVLRKTGSAVTEVPADGTSYMRGDNIGSAKVVFSGNYTTFSPNFIVAGTQYYFAVYAYNGSGQYTNYLTSNPLTGNVTTAGANIGSTYSTLNTQAASFVSDLSAVVNPHTQIYYNDYEETNIALFASRDTANGQKVVTCVYTSEQFVYDEPFDWSVLSREHTYCASWMPTFPDQDVPQYSDQYNLFPVTFEDANAHRSNYPLGEVVNVTYSYMDGKFGTDANGLQVWEPREQHKGDAARAIFYMATAYNGVDGNNWGLPDYISSLIQYGQDQDVLKAWHWQDPPDAWEIARNDFLDSLQGNRNPFVDSVNYVCYINFDDMTYVPNPGGSPCTVTPGFNENTIEALSIYPNPSDGNFGVNISLKENEEVMVRISDVAGRMVYERKENLKTGNNRLMIGSSGWGRGIYTLQLLGENNISTQKLIIK